MRPSKRAIVEAPGWLTEAARQPQRAPRGGADVSSPSSALTAAIIDDLAGGLIPEGRRNWTMFREACRLRARGHDFPTIRAALELENQARCETPLDGPELTKIARSACRYPAGSASPQTTPEVLEALDELAAGVEDHFGPKVGDHTDRDFYIALMRFGVRHGTRLPSGDIRVSVGLRPVTEEASIGSTRTAWKAQNRLRRRGLIRRDGTGRGPKSGAFVLVVEPRAKGNTRPPSEHLRSGEPASVSPCAPPLSAPRLRWSAPGQSRLGKIRGRIIDVLEARGPLTALELAGELGHKRPRDLRRRYLDDEQTGLIPAGVVECVAGEYRLTAWWRQALNKRRAEDGEIEAARRQKRHHEEERERFREAWRRGDVVSKEEFARRQRNRNRIRPEERHISGTVEELEPAPAADPEIVEALRAALVRWPDKLDDYPSWWASTLKVEDWLPYKPDKAAVELALVELRMRGEAAA